MEHLFAKRQFSNAMKVIHHQSISSFVVRTVALILLLLTSYLTSAQQPKTNSPLVHNLLEFAKTSAVTGREAQASDFIKSLLPNLDLKQDKLGNLFAEIGSGSPRTLISTPIDEPGYVISQIQDNGYLKIARIGRGHTGALYHQFLQGHEVQINTAAGPVIGVSTVPSSHFEGLRTNRESRKGPFQWQEAYIDVGASSAQEVAQMGIALLDPITLNKKPILVDGAYISAPAMNSKAAAIAMARAANSLNAELVKGTVVFAWTTLGLLNGKGRDAIINMEGPFDETFHYNPTGINATNEIHLASEYTNTPVEMIAISEVENLTNSLIKMLGANSNVKELPKKNFEINKSTYTSFKEEDALVSDLIARYGVSGSEEEVRAYILSKLPQWAKPKVDESGNIILSFGQGSEHKVFVAHMDETGFEVESIQSDGRLVLRGRGGMFPWLVEAQPALVHSSSGKIQAVFEPRNNYPQATTRSPQSKLLVYAGFESKQEAESAGVVAGQTKVTMPKEMIRLSENKATARGFDDRVGSAALLLSLKNLDPNSLSQKITFVWSTAEEVGLVGATFAAKSLSDASIVHPIDTYVSSDDPYINETFADCPLGEGLVIRVLESINFISRENLKSMQDLATKNNIKTQYGMTAGGTDGQPFLAYGIPSVPLSWPGRYSHSPIEVMDYRDMRNLVSMITAIIKETN